MGGWGGELCLRPVEENGSGAERRLGEGLCERNEPGYGQGASLLGERLPCGR